MKLNHHIGLLLLCLGLSHTLVSQIKIEKTIEAIKNASLSEVLVASHRGDWRNYAENSIEGIESCIQMGVDIVEIDVAKTKDGHLILMHDKTIDRATNGKGSPKDYTLDEIRRFNLKNGLGRTSEYKIPTLKEAMLVAKDKIIVNLDKADEYFDDVYQILEETGTIGQAIIKSEKPYEELLQEYGDNLNKMLFMPVLNLDKMSADSVFSVLDKNYLAYELVFNDDQGDLLLQIKDKVKGKSSIWINSLWPSLCAGRSDDRAVTDPDSNWGYLIEHGANMLQTDRPQMMIDYLNQKGLR
jgi:glycerophosphoryl diester phosphodiesterase